MVDQPLPPTWTARWIEPVEAADGPSVQRPAHHLATEFRLGSPVRSAALHITAHGLYEAFVNGTRLGQEELAPGFSAYRKRLQVQTHDVAGLLVVGDNALGALLSDGWWRGQHSSARRTDSYGSTTALLAQLHITFESGEEVVVASDESWRSTPSHVLAADLIAGEVHDLRKRVAGWAEPGTDRSTWHAVQVADHGFATLRPTTAPPVRRIEELRAVSVREIAPGRNVVDFGQNSNGWVRLTDLGPAGARTTIVYGEALDTTGDVTQDDISHSDRFPDRSFQTDVVVSAGDGSVFEPRHSTKGFRYVRVEGHEGPLDPASITSVVVHSALRRIGGFTCSDDRLNRLHAAAEWSFRGNACGIPTDCPTRERAAWTGDWQTFVQTAAYLYDVHDFSASWLEDLAAEQWPDGCVLNMVPDPHDFDLPENARWRALQGSSGWGDAACHVPWELYLATGRDELLRRHLGTMRGWVDFAAERARSGRHPGRVTERPEPMPHEEHLWDAGFHFGEWCEPLDETPAEMSERVRTMDHGPTATAFLYRSASELARAAEVLGEQDVAARYADLAERVRGAWCAEFVDQNGQVQPQSQANLVRALAFDLLPAELRQRAADDLVALVRAAGTHLGTGFMATPYLLPVLADHGHLDVAYKLLLQNTAPSWLVMIEQGATTIWESWTGLGSELTGSLNHCSKGAVVSFLHRYVAGLQPLEPGYRRFRVAPRPGGGLSQAETFHDSPYGRISVAWRLHDGAGELDAEVPPGTSGLVLLPDGRRVELVAGHHRLQWSVTGSA
jgi:alpha-L-rhamnosidase